MVYTYIPIYLHTYICICEIVHESNKVVRKVAEGINVTVPYGMIPYRTVVVIFFLLLLCPRSAETTGF